MEPFIGQLMLFAGTFAPRGWAFCNGQLLPIAQNSALFSLLGTTYGGDGRVNFALPDLRSRVPVGMGQGPGLSNIQQGEKAGSPAVTITQSQMPQHTHALSGVSVNVRNPGYVDVPVNIDGGDGNSKIPTNILSADGAAKSFTDSPPNEKYSGSGLPVQGMQIEVNGGQITPAGGNQPLPIMQPYLGMNYCIALEGVYPSRD